MIKPWDDYLLTFYVKAWSHDIKKVKYLFKNKENFFTRIHSFKDNMIILYVSSFLITTLLRYYITIE